MQLEPFAYLFATAQQLESTDPDLWAWFGKEHIGERYRQRTSADIEHRAERIPKDDTSYARAETACVRLAIDVPLGLRRLRVPGASRRPFLVFMPDEVLIVLAAEDDALSVADEVWLAALGREMARYRLYAVDNGRLHVAMSVLQWLSRQEGCTSEIFETLRRFKLMTEAYCDIGGFVACEDRHAALRALLNPGDGQTTPSVESLLALADQPASGPGDVDLRAASSDVFLRAQALARWTQQNQLRVDISSLLPTAIELGALDLIDQASLRDLTARILARVLAEPAAGSLAAVAQAREMIPGASLAGHAQPLDRLSSSYSASVIDYLCYLLLDFATAEGTRLRDSIAVAAAAADELGIGSRFREIARQELRGRRGLQAGLAPRRAA